MCCAHNRLTELCPQVIDKFYKNRPTLEQAQEALKRLTGEGALSKEEEEANRKCVVATGESACSLQLAVEE